LWCVLQMVSTILAVLRWTQSDWSFLLFGQFLLWVWSGRNRCLADRSFECRSITIVFIFSISEPPDGAHYKKPTHSVESRNGELWMYCELK
jgi:hypothetical protein